MPAGQQAEKGATVGPQVDLSRGLSHDPLIRTAQPETGSCACASNMRDSRKERRKHMRMKDSSLDFSSAILVTRNARVLENESLLSSRPFSYLKMNRYSAQDFFLTARIETGEEVVGRRHKGSARKPSVARWF